MYEVFINNNRLIFDHPESEKKYSNRAHHSVFYNSPDSPRKIVLAMANTSNRKDFIILSQDPEKTEKKFFKNFKRIEAAGGLVINKEGLFLLIFRNGKWDLPKGKIEEGENPEKAAIREVKEETGIDLPEIVKSIGQTYHCYLLNGKPILKKTFWFKMKSKSVKSLIPQFEEGITEVLWANKRKVSDCMKNSYVLVADLITKYQSSHENYN